LVQRPPERVSEPPSRPRLEEYLEAIDAAKTRNGSQRGAEDLHPALALLDEARGDGACALRSARQLLPQDRDRGQVREGGVAKGPAVHDLLREEGRVIVPGG